MTGHFTLLWREPPSTVAFVKLKDLKLSRASAEARPLLLFNIYGELSIDQLFQIIMTEFMKVMMRMNNETVSS